MSPQSDMPPLSVVTTVAGRAMHSVMLAGKNRGDAPVFVLVPGMGLSGRYMMPTAELLTSVGTVWVPDLPGCGLSERPPSVPSIPELADALAEWIKSHGLESPILIGNSLGAQVIVDFAVRHPQALNRAILVAPTIDPEAPQVFTQLLRLLVDVPREPLALYWIVTKDYLRTGLGWILHTLRHALEDPVESKLPLLTCPVLVIRGGRDPIVPQQWAERAAGLIPNGRIVTLPGAAHAVNFNSPVDLSLEVIKFSLGF